MRRLSSTPRKAVQDICRVCQKEFKEKKQKHRLFSCNLDRALSNILEQPVCKGDGLPEAICSDCSHKVVRFQRLEKEMQSMRQSVKERHAITASVVHSKRLLHLSPSAVSTEPQCKKPVTASPPTSPLCTSSGPSSLSDDHTSGVRKVARRILLGQSDSFPSVRDSAALATPLRPTPERECKGTSESSDTCAVRPSLHVAQTSA